MLNIIIILLILVGLTVHRYLSSFWDQGILPYPMGFLVFGNLFVILYLANFVWIFGLLAGIIISAMCFLQLVYSAVLWIVSLPWVIRIQRDPTILRVNPMIYGGFSFLVFLLGVLTVANFNVSPYMSIWQLIGENAIIYAIIFVVVLIIGNLARVSIMYKLIK